MLLQIVPLQLRLFAHKLDSRECAEYTGRTGAQWIRSIIAYLEFRAGEPWRNRNNSCHRLSPDRLEYLEALRLISGLLSPAGIPEKFVANGRKPPVIVRSLPQVEPRSRLDLVNQLMQANPALTNRKILLALSKAKLARMLDAAKERRSA